jgi:hypothetical protein
MKRDEWALYKYKRVIQILINVIAFFPVQLSFAQGVTIVNGNVPFQRQLHKKETIYVIRDEIDLKGATVSVPHNCTLKFEGGALKNGTLVYDNTYIDGNYKVFCKCQGLIANDIVEPHMYGARGDSKTDDAYSIQQSINSGKQVIFRRGTYLISTPIIFDRQNHIVDFNFATIKKTSRVGYNYKYENYDFNKIPCVLLVKPYKSNTSGHIVVKNLIIDGGKNNTGIHAIWCRNVIFDNVRIYGTTKGFVYNGFTNTFKDITIWDSNDGFVIAGGLATLFERCFTSKCGWKVDKANGLTLISCSSDDFNPCYKISNSTVSMIGCTHESKGEGIVVNNSVLELTGDFESHIYDSTKSITYIKATGGSVVYAKGCTFRLNNYMKKKIPDSNLFEIYDNSKIELEGRIDHGNGLKIYKSNNGKMSLNGRNLKSGKN